MVDIKNSIIAWVIVLSVFGSIFGCIVYYNKDVINEAYELSEKKEILRISSNMQQDSIDILLLEKEVLRKKDSVKLLKNQFLEVK